MDVSEHTENFFLKRKKKEKIAHASRGRSGVRRRRLTFLLSPLLSYGILGRPNFPIPLCLGRLPREYSITLQEPLI